MSEMLVSSTGNQTKMVFVLQVFNDSHFLLNNFPHICLKCLFHMDNHIDLVGTVKFVEKLVNQKTLVKKGTCFFWFQVGAFNISDVYYKIQKLNK